MKIKTPKPLPKSADQIANGGLYRQFVRCGKSNCKCAGGERHTAYYFFTRRNGKLIKSYVRRADVEAFSVLAKRASLERREKRKADKVSSDLLSKFRAELLVNNRVIQSMREGVTDDR